MGGIKGSIWRYSFRNGLDDVNIWYCDEIHDWKRRADSNKL